MTYSRRLIYFLSSEYGRRNFPRAFARSSLARVFIRRESAIPFSAMSQ